MPRAAVVIPVHNRADLLEATLWNVCLQDEKDLEIIVVDDHSTEDVESVVTAQADPRIRFIRSEEKGASAARNLGLSQASAPFLVFLDSDDLLHPSMISRLGRVLDDNPAASLAVGQMATFKGDPMSAEFLWNTFDPTRFPGKQKTPTERFLAHEPVWGIHGPLWRREALVSLGGLDASLPLAQDFELHARALARGHLAILVPALLSYARTHESISIGSDSKLARQRILLEVFEALEREDPGHRAIFQGNYLWIAAFAADAGIVDLAHLALIRANVGGWNGFRFRMALRGRVITGRHAFHVMMHSIAKQMGHDLDSRVDWRFGHRIADEPGLDWPPMPPEAWQKP